VTTISHYRLEGEIGRGGMGIVYRAVDTRLGRPVAIKVLPPEATIGVGGTDSPGGSSRSERHRRFLQEARAASALSHPHIVTIYEVDEHEGTTFIAMELVEGTPLDKLLAKGPLPVTTALEYGVQIAAALEAAHAAGIIHRDIKPANIMIGADGRARVLDWLAKLTERRPTDATITGVGTLAGTILGTAAYMSPEQAQGERVDARSDIFSFGAVLYEMLAGRRPFAGSSDVGVITAILRDQPAPLHTVRPDLPADVEPIVARALAKDPAQRYQSGAAIRADLASAHGRLTRPADAVWRRPAVFVPVALLLIAAAGFGAWQMVQARRARWARLEALPEIERLQHSGRTMHALRLAREAARFAPEEVDRVRAGWLSFNVITEPADALIAVRNYRDLEGEWEPLGSSPVVNARLPFGYYRVRVTKAGYKTLEIGSAHVGRQPLKLTPEADAAPGMVFVPGGSYRAGVAAPIDLPDYWIDQLEVTNALFKQFVDAGGYRDAKYWKQPFRDGARELPFDEAMARFRDATGRAGPATWELGSYPEGRADYPVGGISWFEAAAYAEFAGKALPTLYHWFRASGTDEIYSDVLQLSNFSGKGPTKAGEHSGLGPWGTLDMAGNVKEWCTNETADAIVATFSAARGTSRAIASPSRTRRILGRSETFGVRLVKNLGPAEHAAVPVGRVTPDPSTIVPVSDEVFAIYRGLYEYDRTPLDARVDSVDDSSPLWRKDTVSFAAAYGNQRVPAFLFLPKNAKPPYQTIVLFPSGYARVVPSSGTLDLGTFDFIMRSGRALLYPVYQGTYERRGNVQPGPAGARDVRVQWAKDFFRAVDYLETRPEIDKSGSDYSLSMGRFGDSRRARAAHQVAVFIRGLSYTLAPEVQPANFAAHQGAGAAGEREG
jgi:formylglycine-generating enzyme required for sulfatase activity